MIRYPAVLSLLLFLLGSLWAPTPARAQAAPVLPAWTDWVDLDQVTALSCGRQAAAERGLQVYNDPEPVVRGWMFHATGKGMRLVVMVVADRGAGAPRTGQERLINPSSRRVLLNIMATTSPELHGQATELVNWVRDYILNGGSSDGSVWSGGWVLRFPAGAGGRTMANLKLTVKGRQVTGEYDFLNARITGTLDGNTVKGTWTNDLAKGTFVWTLQEGSRRFTGYYQIDGRAEKVEWSGSRP